MASGAKDRRGLVQRLREARDSYRGPFSGEHVQAVVEDQGYEALEVNSDESFLVYRRDGRRPIPVNVDWQGIWDNDPTFRCIQRDLGMSRSTLRTRLNEARQGR